MVDTAQKNNSEKENVKENIEKKFDVVVFGATGFTGELTANYLNQHEDIKKLSWAIAGRNKQKLEQLIESYETNKPDYILADVASYDSLLEMARQAKVIITTVGPYTRYGEPLVRACIEAKTDYVDLVGEPNFVDLMRYRYHKEALEAGVKIINACGFDSIPHDLGALFTVNALRKKFPEEKRKYLQINCGGFVSTNAKFSGGTWHSAITAMSKMLAHQKRKKSWLKEGYTGKEKTSKGRKAVLSFPRIFYSKIFSQWVLSLPTIDPEIVIRSAQLRDDYGMRFYYQHFAVMEKWWHIPALVSGGALVFIFSQFRIGRERLGKYIKPGDGPSEQERANSWFKVDFFASAGKEKVHTRVSGGDPGYSETSKMLAESALCLALQREQCPEYFGVTTTAAAMGEALIERLQSADLKFEVIE